MAAAPTQVVLQGTGPVRVLGVLLREVDGSVATVLRLESPRGGTIEVAERSDLWRPLMSVADANTYKTLLDSGIRLAPRWTGMNAVRKLAAVLEKSLDPDDFIMAFLHTAPPRAGRPPSKVLDLRNRVATVLDGEIKLVLATVRQPEVDSFIRNPRPEVPQLSILLRLEELSRQAARPATQNKKTAYLSSLRHRAHLISQLD